MFALTFAELLTHAQTKHGVTKFILAGSEAGREQRRILGYSPIVALANKPFEQKRRLGHKCLEVEK